VGKKENLRIMTIQGGEKQTKAKRCREGTTTGSIKAGTNETKLV